MNHVNVVKDGALADRTEKMAMDGTIDKDARQAAAPPVTQDTKTLIDRVPDFEKIDGWLQIGPAELLFAAAASVKSGCIVEVGSYRGRSTVALCAGSMAGHKIPVFAIEPHEHFVGVKGGAFGPSDRGAFFRTMLRSRFAAIVRLVNLSSEVVSPGWDKPVSLLFIDGDHRYEAVLNDFAAWRPHLVDHGLVIFYDAEGTGTRTLITDLTKEGALTHLQTIGRLAMFRYNASETQIDPTLIARVEHASVFSNAMPPLSGPRAGQSIYTIGEHVYYSAQGGYLYQAIPKSGAATIKAVLLELEGLPAHRNDAMLHNKRLNGFPGTEGLTTAEQAAVLSGETDTFNFVMVRDPYARMASSYADKIQGSYDRSSDHWIKKIEASAAQYRIKLSDKITFEEFVRVVSLQSVDEMDPNWRPQYHEGKFSSIKFDFIGRTEMFSTDFAYVLERIGAPPEIMHRAIQPRIATGANLSLWSSVSADIRQAFLQVFEVDFDSLRYPMRHASVQFSAVNQDRPKAQSFKIPNAKGGNSSKFPGRKERLLAKTSERTSPGNEAGQDAVAEKIAGG